MICTVYFVAVAGVLSAVVKSVRFQRFAQHRPDRI
jgi:hypothetical protein